MREFVPVAFLPPYLHFTLIASALCFLCLYFFIKRLRSTFHQLQRKWHPPAPYDPRLLKYQRNAAIFWLFLLLPSALLLAFAIYLSSYQLLAKKAVIAGQAEFRGEKVTFTGYDGKVIAATVHGSRAAGAGIFLKFPDILGYLGLHSYHKIITFRGSSQFEYHYQAPDPKWVGNYVDVLFEALYTHRNWFQFLAPTYRESPYFASGKHRIFATHSGYIVN
jgi:hypothetical protein